LPLLAALARPLAIALGLLIGELEALLGLGARLLGLPLARFGAFTGSLAQSARAASLGDGLA
jgi:hypothetical protein